MPTNHTLSLSAKILIALASGLVLGLILKYGIIKLLPDTTSFINHYIIDGLFELAKKLFLNSLQMLVVPLVFISLICGTCTLAEPSKLGRLAGQSILLYLLTTAIAITIALIMASIFEPGAGITYTEQNYVPRKTPSIVDVIANLIPSNPINAMSSGNMLQVIVVAILFGLAVSIAGEKGRHVANLFTDLNAVILKLVGIIMHIAPYGVFCIMASVAYQLGLDSILKLGKYFFLVVTVLLLHAFVTYPLLLKLLAGLSPVKFLIKLRPAMLFAFSTASSAATLPVTMEVARKRLGVGQTTASFVLPLGATINMDGTAIMQGVATVFIAQISGIDLSMSQFLIVILMATMASIGTAGVPGVGLIMLTMVLHQVGLPAEAIGMIIGIDRLLDMVRTAVNITGDAMVSCVVSKSGNDFDIETFNDATAGVEFEQTKA